MRADLVSESDDQKKRPIMLARDSSPTKPARGSRVIRDGEHLLAHGRGLAQNADARRHVHAEHHPEQPELRRLESRSDLDLGAGHQRLRARRLGDEARGRQPSAGTRTVSTPNIMKMK